MFRFLRPSRSSAHRGILYNIGWWIGRLVIWFVVLSVGMTLLYKWVPVPVTLTMMLDRNGFDKDWAPLSRIDRTMVDAVIAGEDAKFCSHNGFDTAAIEKAMQRNASNEQRGSARLRGARRSASRPPRTCSCGKALAGLAMPARGSRCGSPS